MTRGRRHQAPRPGQVARDLEGEIRALGGIGLVGNKEPRREGVLSSGCDAIDQATGIGGFPLGRVVLLHSKESAGKTTLVLETIREAQKAGGIGVFFDFEQKLDLTYAEQLGVNVDTLIRSDHTLQYIEQGFERMTRLCEIVRARDAECPIVFGWDSLQMAASMSEEKRDFETTGWGNEAHSYSRCFRKFVGPLRHARALGLFVSQVRTDPDSPTQGAERIGVGKSCGHVATMILQWTAPRAAKGAEKNKEGEAVREGNLCRVVIKKNQVAPPFAVANYTILYGKGADPASSLLHAAEAVGMATRGASGYWSLDLAEGPLRVQQKTLRRMADEKPDVFAAIRAEVRARFSPDAVRVDPQEQEEGDDLDGETVAQEAQG